MLRGLAGLTAIEVSFWALLQPAWLPSVTVESPMIWFTLGGTGRYGLGWPMKLWQSADRAGSSVLSPSSSSERTSFSSGLGTRCAASRGAAARVAVPAPARPADPSTAAGAAARPATERPEA